MDGQGNVYVAAVPIEEWSPVTQQTTTLVSSATLNAGGSGGSSSPYALRTDPLGN